MQSPAASEPYPRLHLINARVAMRFLDFEDITFVINHVPGICRVEIPDHLPSVMLDTDLELDETLFDTNPDWHALVFRINHSLRQARDEGYLFIWLCDASFGFSHLWIIQDHSPFSPNLEEIRRPYRLHREYLNRVLTVQRSTAEGVTMDQGRILGCISTEYRYETGVVWVVRVRYLDQQNSVRHVLFHDTHETGALAKLEKTL